MKTKTILLTTLILTLTINATAQVAPELEEEMNQLQPQERVEVILTTGPDMNQTHVNQSSNLGEVEETFNQFNTIHLELPVQAVDQLEQRNFVETVEPNYQVKTSLEESTTQVEAETAWENNITGNGIDVAVIDTGIQSTHPELEVENQVDFTGEGTQDDNGHGTHVAGIIASQDNENTGVAYSSNLQDVKVLGENGTGEGSDLLSGLEWAIENDVEVAVMSLGAEVDQCDGEDFISDAVDQAVQEGVFVTVAAGNQGPETQTLTAPGCATEPLTVGSVNKNNEIADYSSRGPTADNRVKPDVVAPGSSIESTYNNEGFETLSGTSMATPHAAAQAATILQQNSDLTPEEVKQEIKQNTDDLGLEENTQGTGLINLTATTQIEDTNQTNETEENETIEEEGEVHTQIQNPEDQDTITVGQNLTIEWVSINNKTTQLQELETSIVKLDTYEATIPENMLIGTTEEISREHTIQSDDIPQEEGEYELTVTDNWQNDTETTQTVTIQIQNNTEEENQTENRTGPDLPPQASETARKATAGFFNPNSPFYQFDLAFDRAAVAIGLKTRESVMEERASEARAMAETGNQKGAERAVSELRKTAGNDENSTRQAEETLERVIQDAPEEAQQGLRNAYNNVQNRSRNQAQGNRPGNPGSQGNQENTGQNNTPDQSENQGQSNQQNGQSSEQGNQQEENPGQAGDQGNQGQSEGEQGENSQNGEQGNQGNNQDQTQENQPSQEQNQNTGQQSNNQQENDQTPGPSEDEETTNGPGQESDTQENPADQQTNPTSSDSPSSSSSSSNNAGSGNSNPQGPDSNPGNAP